MTTSGLSGVAKDLLFRNLEESRSLAPQDDKSYGN